YKVGDVKPITVDVRIIAATNRNLPERADQGAFRADLFDRLNVVMVQMPSLRDRRQDIRELAEYFLGKAAAEERKDIPPFSPDSLRKLMEYAWPGNVRELENAIKRAVLMCEGGVIEVNDLPALQERASGSLQNDFFRRQWTDARDAFKHDYFKR